MTVPPGWPDDVPPPEAHEWEAAAMVWLLDVAPHHFRLDSFLISQPVILARRVVEHLGADVHATREAWVPDDQWARADLPAEAHGPVIVMLRRVGPTMVGRLHSAELVRDALTSGKRWIPRL